MAARKKSGLDDAADAITAHVRAIRDNAESDKLDSDDLRQLLDSAEQLRKIEELRASTVLRSLTGRGRIESLPIAELEKLLDRVEGVEDIPDNDVH